MPTLEVTNLSFSFSAQPLLDGVSFSVGNGERAVLVGPNGSGKTTLLRLVRGELCPDRGHITMSNSGNTSMRFPYIRDATGTVQDYLDDVLAGPRELLTRFGHLTKQLSAAHSSASLVKEYDQLITSLTLADAWSLDARIDEALGGLGLGQLSARGRQRELGTLSPGQAGRLELAGILLARPAILVLDEPTNHLDDDAVAFLIQQITDWSGPVLMTSHDRAFIEDTATVIYDLDIAPWQAIATGEGGGVVSGVYRCSGTYSYYLAAKQHARMQHHKLHAMQQSEKRAIRSHRRRSEDIARGGVKLATAQGKARKFFSDRAETTALRRTRNDDKRLEELAKREVRKPRDYQLRLNLPHVESRGGLAIMARRATVPGRLAPITFDLATGEHLLLTGPNGAGKTTLLTWLANGKPPNSMVTTSSGSISINGTLAYVPQRLPRTDDLNIAQEHWTDGIGELGAGILHPAMWATPVGQLSDGNQRRAQIALAVAQKPEILIIDEPTNYLDLAAIEEFDNALRQWNGTLIIASHDRWLINHWQGTQIELSPTDPAP
ncbi:ABC-F family ATP-binding cassette domain-containing protein [Trueperella pecoris]|uniref:ABC-F family ATP-binding cassette domain-containing protein n=1 Tax=Trueperella pecoris TaxID=2733571 RepID=A0A7M1QXW7_9ACTO|nr:ATP-binding cassette domain-containing protein [Trueperella pecoris]QOR46696.1 ABC-F family ATP-binding cassette domain-containing protein [Trueperella pecoris]